MNLTSISLRNMRVRALSSTLTAVSIALGTALVASLWLLMDVASDRYRASVLGYGAVVGPKEGSPLELTLNTVFHYGYSPNTIPLREYLRLRPRSTKLATRATIIYAIAQMRGDSYYSYPVIGTTDEMFSKFRLGRDADKKPVLLKFAKGGPFAFSHEDLVSFAGAVAADIQKKRDAGARGGHDHDPIDKKWRKVVIGATVARRLNRDVGDLITPVHGVDDSPLAHPHPEAQSEVVGVLAPTGGPIDRAVFIPAAVFLSMADHDAIDPKLPALAENVSLSAVIVGCAQTVGANRLRSDLSTDKVVQAAIPWTQITRLLRIIGDTTAILRVVAWLVLFVTASSVLLGLYNTMNERRREIAIMRSLGARRGQIFLIILQEAVFIALGAAVVGIGLCHLAAYALVSWVERKAGITPDWAAFSLAELWLILGVGALGAVAGLLPALKGSRTPVAENLGPIS